MGAELFRADGLIGMSLLILAFLSCANARNGGFNMKISL